MINFKIMRSSSAFSVGSIIFIPFIVLALLVSYLLNYSDKRDLDIVVNDKTVKMNVREGTSSIDYLIYTDKGTFEISDQLWYGKFNSSDIYGSIRVGDTIRVTVSGKRVPFLSNYPNIVRVN